MTTIRLAANHITAGGTFNLAHLQIVNMATEQEIEVQSPTSGLFGSWVYEPVQSHAGNTSNYGVSGYYSWVDIDLGGRSTSEFWDSLAHLHGQFRAQNPPIQYDINKNSNSYITTLLYRLGIDVDEYIPALYTTVISWLPGAGNDVMNNTTDAIGLVIQGTSGNDKLYGGVAPDVLQGGDGQDLLVGHNWALNPHGWSDNQRDVLFGGDGYDGYIVSQDSTFFDSFLIDLPGDAFAATDNFSYALFDFTDRVEDADGSGYIQFDSTVAGSVNFASWQIFDGIDGVTYDLKTNGTVYELMDVWTNVYSSDDDVWNWSLVSAQDVGLQDRILGTFDAGRFYIFSFDIEGMNDGVTYRPIAEISAYAQGHLDMLFY